MTTATTTISALRVGDIVLSIWGTDLTTPATVTKVDISATYGGGTVSTAGGGIWPVRKNDTRPVVVVA